MRQKGEHSLRNFDHNHGSRSGFLLSTGIEGINLGSNIWPDAPLNFDRKQIHRNNDNPGITFREAEVLQLLSNGDSSKMIADKLHISETTAITHRKNLIKKLNVRNTAHLIKVAFLYHIIV